MLPSDKTVTKIELAGEIAQLGISLRYAKKIAEALIQTWADHLIHGEVVHLKGFGSFQYKVRKARNGRNPKTGQMVSIPEKRVIWFRPGKELKALVRQSDQG
jgi:nucleoid DNA-binding protein